MSNFLDLPCELRRLVYIQHFSSQTLNFPLLSTPLLLVSKQVHDESLPCYYRNVQFDFASTKHLMDFLSTIDQIFIPQLGHISVTGYPLFVFPYVKRYRVSRSFHISQLLPLFPGLQLLSLQVRDMYHELTFLRDSASIYFGIEGLIDCHCYKELTYTTPNDAFMSSFGNEEGLLREPQPSTWDAMLKEKDGADSGASVEMVCGNHLYPLTEYEAPLRCAMTHPRPMEIRIRRGEGACHAQTTHPAGPHLGPDVRGFFGKMTWDQVKKHGSYIGVMEDRILNEDETTGDHDPAVAAMADGVTARSLRAMSLGTEIRVARVRERLLQAGTRKI